MIGNIYEQRQYFEPCLIDGAYDGTQNCHGYDKRAYRYQKEDKYKLILFDGPTAKVLHKVRRTFPQLLQEVIEYIVCDKVNILLLFGVR